jgi:superfamily II DNA helicase RecQ
LGQIRQNFPNVPLMALTASATPLYDQTSQLAIAKFLIVIVRRVQDDIARILGMDSGRLFKFIHPFNRSNLFYEVCRGSVHLLPELKMVANVVGRS